MNNQPSLQDYLQIIECESVDAETKELAQEALKSTLKFATKFMANPEELLKLFEKISND